MSYSADHVEIVQILSRSFSPEMVGELAAKCSSPAAALEIVNNWRKTLSQPPLADNSPQGKRERIRNPRKADHYEAPKKDRLEWIEDMIVRDRVPMIYTQEVVIDGSVRPVVSIFSADPALAVMFLQQPGYQMWSRDAGIY